MKNVWFKLSVIFLGILSTITQGKTTFSSVIDQNFGTFFFDGLSENCQLPCWYGLELGATSKQVDNTWESFGFGSEIIDTEYNNRYVVLDLSDFQLETGENLVESELLVNGMMYNNFLQAIEIMWIGKVASMLPAKKVIERLGTPSNFLIGTTIELEYTGITVILAYPEINTYFRYSLHYFKEANLPQYTLCLDPSSWQSSLKYTSTFVYIAKPEHEEMQYRTVLFLDWVYHFQSIHEVTKLTLEQLSELILNQGNECLTLKTE